MRLPIACVEMTKKATLYFFIGALLVMTFATGAKSTGLGSATILPGGANFRVAPDLQSKVLQILPKNSEVELLNQVGPSWYRASYNDRTGYVHWSRLQFNEPLSRPRNQLAQGSLVTARQEAVVAFAGKKWSEVISLLHPWSKSTRSEFNDLFMLAFAFKEIRQFELALAMFEEAINRHQGAIDSGFIEAHRHLGNLYTQMKQYGKAVNNYDRLLERMPVLVWALLGKGDVLIASGEIEKGITEYSRAISCEPENPEPFVRLGNAFLALGDPQKAVRCHKAALQKRPQYEDAMLGMAEAYLKLGEFEQARAILEKATTYPEFARSRRRLFTLNHAEVIQLELSQSRSELEKLQEQLRLSGVVELECSVIARLQPYLYEIRMPSGQHAFLRLNSNHHESSGESIKILASRKADAKINSRNSKPDTAQQYVPYFKQLSEKEKLAYENIRFRIDEKARQVEGFESQQIQSLKNKG